MSHVEAYSGLTSPDDRYYTVTVRPPPTPVMTFILYKDRKREWRWRLMSKGRIVADSGEGYKRKGKCRREIDHIILNIHKAKIEFE